VAAFAVAVVTMASATNARAQATTPATTSLTAPGTWTVTPFIGTGFSGDLDSPSLVFGVAGGYTWTSRVSFEGEFNTIPNSEYSGILELDNNVWSITGNALYHFSGRAFVPYGVFGIGIGHGSLDVDSDDPVLNSLDNNSNEFIVNFGGGVERQIRDRMAVRGDLRYFTGGDLVPDYWRAAIGVTFSLNTP
jgi:opacity protein-like surface antigen